MTHASFQVNRPFENTVLIDNLSCELTDCMMSGHAERSPQSVIIYLQIYDVNGKFEANDIVRKL